MYPFPNLELVHCSVSVSNCCLCSGSCLCPTPHPVPHLTLNRTLQLLVFRAFSKATFPHTDIAAQKCRGKRRCCPLPRSCNETTEIHNLYRLGDSQGLFYNRYHHKTSVSASCFRLCMANGIVLNLAWGKCSGNTGSSCLYLA